MNFIQIKKGLNWSIRQQKRVYISRKRNPGKLIINFLQLILEHKLFPCFS